MPVAQQRDSEFFVDGDELSQQAPSGLLGQSPRLAGARGDLERRCDVERSLNLSGKTEKWHNLTVSNINLTFMTS
ncbi:hypothetical protein Aduo_016951 [Ancylostoma duodenale]